MTEKSIQIPDRDRQCNATQFKHLEFSANHGQIENSSFMQLNISLEEQILITNYDSFHLNVKYLNNCYLIVILVMRDC